VRTPRQALLASIILIGLLQVAIAAAEPKRIVLLHSFGREFLPWSDYSRAIRAELARQSPWPVAISDHSLMSARSSDKAVERAFMDYLRAYYAKQLPDLIVSVGAPAAVFVQRYRHELFLGVPMLLTAVEQRRVDPSVLSASDAVVPVDGNLVAFMENILQLLPDTRTVAIVNGSSPSEQYWRQEITREWKPFEGRISFAWWSDLSFEDMLARSATLPPHSVIVWQLLNVDGAGVSHEGETALNRLRASANAPIFTFQGGYFGTRIVGGPMYSVQEVGEKAAAVALRMLHGESPSDIKVEPIGFAPPKYDWRELRRWGIKESRLPPGSEITFRQPTLWQQFGWQVLGVMAAFLVQSAMIGFLIYERRRRQAAEVLARNSMSELVHMDRMATAGELSASIAHEVNQPLAGISMQAAAGMRWLAADKPDINKARSAFTAIEDATHGVSELVTSVRAMFAKGSDQRVPVDMNSLIQSVLAILRVDLQSNRVQVEMQLDADLPRVECDRVQLQQVILNLIKNAIEAMHAADPRVLRIRTSLTQPCVANISVEDTGQGLDPVNHDRLFKPLVTTKAKGMGMGLAICHSIIERHNGRIWASDAAGKGSIFQFEVPTMVVVAHMCPPRPHLSTAGSGCSLGTDTGPVVRPQPR
jgi:signal transduction histidine kinase